MERGGSAGRPLASISWLITSPVTPQSITAPRELWPDRVPKAWFNTFPVTPQSVTAPRELLPERLPKALFITSPVAPTIYNSPEGTVA